MPRPPTEEPRQQLLKGTGIHTNHHLMGGWILPQWRTSNQGHLICPPLAKVYIDLLVGVHCGLPFVCLVASSPYRRYQWATKQELLGKGMHLYDCVWQTHTQIIQKWDPLFLRAVHYGSEGLWWADRCPPSIWRVVAVISFLGFETSWGMNWRNPELALSCVYLLCLLSQSICL